jgi:hypothetical protein
VSKARPLSETWIVDLFAGAVQRIEQETAGQRTGSEISATVALLIRLTGPLRWLEEIRQRSDYATREAMLECFRVGQAARDLRLGEGLFRDARSGHALRAAGAKGGRAKAQNPEIKKAVAIRASRILERWAAIRQKGPKLTKNAVTVLTAKKENVHPNTVRRLLRKNR